MSMSRTFDYLVCFSVYSLIILIIGKSSFGESDSIGKFFIGERKCGFWRLFSTFVGTWVSAATILGYTGNVFENGTSVIAVTVIPWFIGAGLLYLISGRIYDCDMLTIPQFIGERYHSRFLRTCCALLLSGGYVFYLVIQIKGFGIAVSSLLNINYKVAVFLVYLFILYSSFGGFNSVTKSDCLNLIMLSVSIGVLYLVIVKNVPGHWFLTDQTVHELIKSKGVFENQTAEIGIFVYISMFFGWGMGLASNPQYMVRILAAKDKKTAKHMILHALIFLCVLYFALTQIGLGLRILFPQLKNYCSADDVFIYAVVNLMNTPFSGFFLISVIGACVSTANSQLHLIGCMLSYDVAAQITKKKMSEEQILILARVFIFIGGTAALILSVNPPEDMLSFGADIWGLFSAALAPLIYGGLYWKRRTKAGAVGAFFTGLICSVLFWKMDLQIYWAFPATLCAAAVYVVIPMFEKKRGAEE